MIKLKKLIMEDRDSDYEGQKAMAKKLRRTKINGYGFETNS